MQAVQSLEEAGTTEQEPSALQPSARPFVPAAAVPADVAPATVTAEAPSAAAGPPAVGNLSAQCLALSMPFPSTLQADCADDASRAASAAEDYVLQQCIEALRRKGCMSCG